jgi:hypothetical protein
MKAKKKRRKEKIRREREIIVLFVVRIGDLERKLSGKCLISIINHTNKNGHKLEYECYIRRKKKSNFGEGKEMSRKREEKKRG